jgi:hypothetical protein
MEIVNSSISFGRFEGSGPRSSTRDVTIPNAITSASAVLTGFNVQFSSNDGDHHLGNLDVRLSATLLNPTSVRITAVFGLRDWSGSWDDRYEGQIMFSVIGE